MEIQPGDLSNRHLGVKNSNTDTSEFLTLYPSLNIGGFLSIFSRFRAIPARFSCAIVRNCICNPLNTETPLIRAITFALGK